MNDNFWNKLENTHDKKYNVSITENGAVGYKTTNTKLLDFNFLVSSFRSETEQSIEDEFARVYWEDKLYAIRYLFYLRNVRGGLGERRTFRICLLSLAKLNGLGLKYILKFIPEFGRWDDLFFLYGKVSNELDKEILDICENQFWLDRNTCAEHDAVKKEGISLLGKWLPSESTRSVEKAIFKDAFISHLGISHKEYRKILTSLHQYLDVVEVKMSKGQWDEIDYSKVPSRANLKYNNAFLGHDETRRRKFLEEVNSGDAKINAGVLFPHDIVHNYMEENSGGWFSSRSTIRAKDDGLEAMWKSLGDNFDIDTSKNTICVCDTSLSMLDRIAGTSITCQQVAYALTIFFAEKMTGPFKDKTILFSRTPSLISLKNGDCLRDKLNILSTYAVNENTNIEAVFNLILNTAIMYDMSQSDLPDNILIVSDMEFDKADASANKALFEVISRRYAECGYRLPKLVFWNVNSRTGTIPMKANNNGLVLVGGFSPNICRMVIADETDPVKALLHELDNDIYDPAADAFKKSLS